MLKWDKFDLIEAWVHFSMIFRLRSVLNTAIELVTANGFDVCIKRFKLCRAYQTNKQIIRHRNPSCAKTYKFLWTEWV